MLLSKLRQFYEGFVLHIVDKRNGEKPDGFNDLMRSMKSFSQFMRVAFSEKVLFLLKWIELVLRIKMNWFGIKYKEIFHIIYRILPHVCKILLQ